MELVSQYLEKSPSYQVSHVVELWNKGRVSATPEMGDYINKVCGITRNHFNDKYRAIMLDENHSDSKETAEAILAFIIYCIDFQEFDTLAASLDGNPLQ